MEATTEEAKKPDEVRCVRGVPCFFCYDCFCARKQIEPTLHFRDYLRAEHDAYVDYYGGTLLCDECGRVQYPYSSIPFVDDGGQNEAKEIARIAEELSPFSSSLASDRDDAGPAASGVTAASSTVQDASPTTPCDRYAEDRTDDGDDRGRQLVVEAIAIAETTRSGCTSGA